MKLNFILKDFFFLHFLIIYLEVYSYTFEALTMLNNKVDYSQENIINNLNKLIIIIR